MTGPRTPRVATRRGLFRTVVGATAVLTAKQPLIAAPTPDCPEMDWIPMGYWSRHQHDERCTH